MIIEECSISEMAEEDNEAAEETEVLAVSKEKQKEAKAIIQKFIAAPHYKSHRIL